MSPRLALWLAVASGLAAAAGPAIAQFGPAIDPNAAPVAGLVVRAYGGPAWWTVSDKDTTVYILASPGEPVEGWDKTLLIRRLTGAHTLLTPPEVRMGALGILALPRLKGVMNTILKGKSDRMEAGLPPPLRARFVAARERIGKPATRYGGLSPAMAGFALAGDAYAAMPKPPPVPMAGAPVEATAMEEARRLKVRITPIVTYGGWQFVKAVGELDNPGLDCLAATLDDIDKAYAQPPVAADAGARDKARLKAWADGDVRPMLDAIRSGTRNADFNLNAVTQAGSVYIKLRAPVCLQQIPTVRDVNSQWMPNEAAAIARALKKPGKAVAVVPAGDLLFQGGVLDQLRKQGFTVKAPGEVG